MNNSMYYSKIYGYFDFEDVYNLAINSFENNANFIEIGTWLGKSACFMAETLKAKGSNNQFYCLDHFKGEVNAIDQQKIVKENNGDVYKLFMQNMKDAGVESYIKPICDLSENAVKTFNNEYFDFIFLDAEHHYEDVKRDLNNWFPKLKKGGIFAGHDYRQGVEAAVNEFFDAKKLPIQRLGNCFVVKT